MASVALKRRSRPYKLASMVAGLCLFLGVIPYYFYSSVHHFPAALHLNSPRLVEVFSGAVALTAGLAIIYWAVKTQWDFGFGTPIINAPTRLLVDNGPYALCRNPIQLGAILYYFGTATLAGSINHGLWCAALGLLVGCSYQKFVEEKELLLRFGGEYSAYRSRTPFLLPRLRTARQTAPARQGRPHAHRPVPAKF